LDDVIELAGREAVDVRLMMTANGARSFCERCSSTEGKKLSLRGFGTFTSTPASVDNKSRVPLRQLVRVSVRSQPAAPIFSVASASINFQHELDAPTHNVDAATGAERVQKLGKVRLGGGHQVGLLVRAWRFTPKIAR
jgi:hypothetical protein